MESGPGKRDRFSSLFSPFLQCCASASPFPRLVLVPQSRFGRRKEGERRNRGTERNGVSVDVDRRGIRMVREGSAVVGLNASPGALDDYRGWI